MMMTGPCTNLPHSAGISRVTTTAVQRGPWGVHRASVAGCGTSQRFARSRLRASFDAGRFNKLVTASTWGESAACGS